MLRTDFRNSEYDGLRKYRMIQNDDGTVSFQDVTDYRVVGDTFGGVEINATNQTVNNIEEKLNGIPDRKWELVGSTITGEDIALPSDFIELHIEVGAVINNGGYNWIFNVTIPRAALSSTEKLYSCSSFPINNVQYGRAYALAVTTTKVCVSYVYGDGEQNKGNTMVRVLALK